MAGPESPPPWKHPCALRRGEVRILGHGSVFTPSCGIVRGYSPDVLDLVKDDRVGLEAPKLHKMRFGISSGFWVLGSGVQIVGFRVWGLEYRV